ncbi:MAG: toxin-antitoxin system HicB family antitoxin [Burkholderiales bacterium]|nr:toxin-antitoxin system HicB family antitoxin [Burkholderiales bacterium]
MAAAFTNGKSQGSNWSWLTSVSPEKPASGKLLIRVPPEIHGRALIEAQSMGKSLNQWATEALERAVMAEG